MRKLPILAWLVVLAACGAKGEPRRTRERNTATSADWTGTTASSVEELFAGRFPGVQVFPAPGGISVRIRGASSIHGSNEPLYVIDGMTVQPGPGGALTGINPRDIEKIQVLKDIGSTAQYGVQGANGVILITTKKPR